MCTVETSNAEKTKLTENINYCTKTKLIIVINNSSSWKHISSYVSNYTLIFLLKSVLIWNLKWYELNIHHVICERWGLQYSPCLCLSILQGGGISRFIFVIAHSLRGGKYAKVWMSNTTIIVMMSMSNTLAIQIQFSETAEGMPSFGIKNCSLLQSLRIMAQFIALQQHYIAC